MVKQYEIDQIIEQHFIDNWSNGVQYYFMNAPIPQELPSEYINVLSFADDRVNNTLTKSRSFCSLVAEVRTPLRKGDRRAMVLASEFEDIFENKDIQGIHFNEAVPNKIDGQDHFGVNVIISYDWDSNMVIA